MFGMPSLLNKTSNPIALTLIGNVASALWSLFSDVPPWGIYEEGGGSPAVMVDSVIDMTNSMSSQVSEYRLESGSYASYNKVQKPRVIPIRISKGGSAAERDALIEWLDENVADTTLFDIVTPERAYTSMTLVSYTNRREARQGVTVLYVDCVFQEVRETEPEYTSSGSGGADTSNAASANDKPATPASKAQPQEFKGGGGSFGGKGASGDW